MTYVDSNSSLGEPTDEVQPPASAAQVAAGRIGRNSSIALASHALGAVFGLISLGILARGLGPIGLGRYYTVVVAAAVVQLLADAGFSTLLTHRLARGTRNKQQTLAEANGLLVVVVAASVAILLLVGRVWGAWHGQVTLWLGIFAYAAIACAANQVQQFAMGVFRGFEVFKYEAVGRVLQASLHAAMLVIWAPRSADQVPRALAIYAASHIAAASYLIVISQRKWPCRRVSISWAVLREWLEESVPIGLSDILRRLTLQIDHLLLSIMAPAAMLGIYNVAIRPLGPLSLVPRSLALAIFPYLSRTSDSDPIAFQRTFAKGMRLLWIAGLPAAVTVIVLAEPLVLFLAGPDFLGAVMPMRVLASIVLFSYPSTIFRFVLTALGKQRLFTRVVLFVLLFQAALEAALIPFFGYMGACIGFLIGEVLFLSVGLVVCSELGVGRVDWLRSMRAIPAAIIMAIALWFCFKLSLGLQLVAALLLSAVYLVLCAMAGALEREEIEWVVGVLRQRLNAVRRPTGRPTGGQAANGRSRFLVRLLKTLALAALYFPYIGILRLLGPRVSVLVARLTATVHWFLTFFGAQRGASTVIAAVRPQLSVDLSVSTILRRYLINKHQNFVEWQTHGTRRGRRFVQATYQTIEHREHLDEAIDRGRGVILLVYHFGTTGMGFAALNAHGYAARPHMFRGATYEGEVFDWMARAATTRLAAAEARSNVRIIYHQPDLGFVTLSRILRQGGIVGMNGDGMMATDFVEVSFLGTSLLVPLGPAKLAAATGAPMVPLFTMAHGVWQHRLTLHEPICVPSDSPHAVEEATRHCAGLLEDYVRRFPWMWWTWRRLRLEETAEGSQRLLVRSLSLGSVPHYAPR